MHIGRARENCMISSGASAREPNFSPYRTVRACTYVGTGYGRYRARGVRLYAVRLGGAGTRGVWLV